MAQDVFDRHRTVGAGAIRPEQGLLALYGVNESLPPIMLMLRRS